MASIFYGWWIVLACSAISTYNSGILYYGFTAFFTPLIEEFGWSRAATSLAFSLFRLEGGLAAPVVGFLIDRFGAKKMMTTAVLALGLAFILLSRINSLGTFYAAFLLIALANSLGFQPAGTIVAASWFVKKRGIALGMLTGGISLCGLLVPVLTWIIITWGWRTAAVAAGIGMWVVGLPLAQVIRNRPEPYGLLPDGEAPEKNLRDYTLARLDTNYTPDAREFTHREAMHTRCFWLLALALSIPNMATAALFVHEMPFLLKAGIDAETAAFVVMGTVLISGVGRVGFGWLSDRHNKLRLVAVTMVLQAIGLLLFSSIHVLRDALPFIIFFGVGYGAMVPMRAVIQADYFGTMAFGSIQGLLIGIQSLATMCGPVLAGWFFDLTGDYRMVFQILGVAIIMGIPLILSCTPPAPRKTPVTHENSHSTH